MFATIDNFGYIKRADLVLEAPQPALTTPTRMRCQMAALTQARAKEYFNYDPATGLLLVKERPKSEFGNAGSYTNHLKRIGTAAGSPNSEGYIKVFIDGRLHGAHQVAWLITHGEWVVYPRNEIDHENGDRSDNRIDNLRKTTKSGNQRNSGQRINNVSGVHGVNWVESKRAWIARIWNGPRHVYLGQFYDLREAAIARKAAERVLGYTGTDRKPRDHKQHALDRPQSTGDRK